MPEHQTIPPAPLSYSLKAAYSLKESMAIIGISRFAIYGEINAGRLKIRKIGSRSIVLKADMDAYLAALPIAEPGKLENRRARKASITPPGAPAAA